MARITMVTAFVVGILAFLLFHKIDKASFDYGTPRSNPSAQASSADKVPEGKEEILGSNEGFVNLETMVTIPSGGSIRIGSGLGRTWDSSNAQDSQTCKLVLLVKPRIIIPEEDEPAGASNL